MKLDSMDRLLLGLVLLLTLLLLIQRLVFPFEGLNRRGSEMTAELGRFDFRILTDIREPLLLKVDSSSGAIWKRGLEADGPWVRLNDEVIFAKDSGAARSRKRGYGRRPKIDPEALKELVAEIARLQGIDVASLPEDLSVLTRIVRKGNPPELRGWAIQQIASFPAKDAVPAFVGLLNHTDTVLLIKIVRALASEEDPVAIEPLRRLLDSNPPPRVLQAVTDAIAVLEAEAAKPAD